MDFFGAQDTILFYKNASEGFVKFKISGNFKQNIDETDSKQPKIQRKIQTSLWIFKIQEKNCKPKVSRILQMFLISKTNTIP